MLILGLETSSQRGSVALVESSTSEVLAHAFHFEPNQHAEKLLGLVEEVLGRAGKNKSQLERVAVGVGPGSFTGVRVGLAIAQGLGLGLGIDVVGVGSLRAVAAGIPETVPGVRLVVRDARREEFFVGAYSSTFRELIAPHTIPQKGAKETLALLLSGIGAQAQDAHCLVGTEVTGFNFRVFDETCEPDARAVALIGAQLRPEEAPAVPEYVRGPDVVKPHLPASPLELPRV